LHILATSRQPLGITGEICRQVPPLSVPGPEFPTDTRDPGSALALEDLLSHAAVRLFVERAVALTPAFTLTEVNGRSVAQICRRLDRIPPALERAPASLKPLPPDQIAQRLDDRSPLPTQGSRAALPRQQTLHALMDWSYDLLNPKEQTLFTRLSIFTGG